ncbi:MAG: recombinase family protein [Enterococcus faecalis]
MLKRAALYIRVSTDQQAKHGDSLDAQIATLKDYVSTQDNLTIIDTYIDDGISGQKLYRDEFQRLLEDIKKNRIDIILFTKLDRWFRNLRHYLNIQEILDNSGVTWLAVSQPFFNTDTAYGRSFVNQSMSFAELEAQMASERIKAVFENKIRKGEVVTGSVPFGYKICDKKLIPNENAPIAKDIFKHYSIHNSIRLTVEYLFNEYDITRSSRTIKHMLRNRKYIGEVSGNKNYCPPIVDKETFEKVQNLLDKNISSIAKRTYIFSGLVVCSCCGKKMTGRYRKRKYIKKDGTVMYYTKKVYRCNGNTYKRNKCPNKINIAEGILEEYLLNNIKADAENFEAKQKKIAVSAPEKNNNSKILKKIERLKKAYLNEVISLDEYKKDRKELEQMMIQVKPKETIVFKSNWFNKNIESTYRDFDEEEKRFVWRSVLKNLIVDPHSKITINFLTKN